jgi:hypothetical protein
LGRGNNLLVPLSIHEVYKKDTKTGKRKKKEKTPAKPKNKSKPKHPNRNQPTKLRYHYTTARALFAFVSARTKIPSIIIN